MSQPTSIVIVGGGLAAAKAVETLRKEGFDRPIRLIGEEPDLPYERPPLSKGFLNGTKTRDSVFVHDRAWYLDHDVDVRVGTRATGVDAINKSVTVESGDQFGYDKLLLATGSSPRRISLPGSDLDGVLYLRNLGQSEQLRARLREGGHHVVLVGGGWIGLEVASAARNYRNDVTVVEPQRAVLNAALGSELGGMFTDLHREHGVTLHLNDGVDAILGSNGSVTGVKTTSGRELSADVVVVGIGARPNVELALSAGIDVDNGVLVDASLRSSNPDIYAAGDIANADNPVLGRRIRVEHWANALNGGPVAAKAMLGQDVVLDRIPYFFTDQYDLGMEYTGDVGPDGHDRIVYRGDREGREFIAFWTKEGRILAGMNVNVWDVVDDVQALIKSGQSVDLDRLADPAVPLSALG